MEFANPGPPNHFSWFEKLVTVLAYIYLLRVPFLIGAAIVFLPVLALAHGSPFVALLQNLFFMNTEGTLWVTTAALVLSWSLLLTARLVLLNGHDRFGLRQALTSNQLRPWVVLAIAGVALPIVLGQFTQRHDFAFTPEDIRWRVAAVAAGVLLAYALAFIGLFLAVLAAPQGTQPVADTFPAPRFMKALLRYADAHGVPRVLAARVGGWLKSRLPFPLWTGYLDPATGFPWSGHWLAAAFAAATAVLYFGLDLYRRTWANGVSRVPALAYALLLLLAINWLVSFLAFLFDRYRIPLIAPVLFFCVLSGNLASSDHYYTTTPSADPKPITPDMVLASRQKQAKPIVVIATAGGGIQAGAWTAQVLEGLEEQSKEWKTRDFADSVSLISSVSGGAMGSMFYLNLYDQGRTPPFSKEDLCQLTKHVSASSLDNIGWALAYRDFPHIIFSYFNRTADDKRLDRGYMLEDSWRDRANIRANLSHWRAGVAEGDRPAAIFNATIAETGKPLLLSTTNLLPANQHTSWQDFYDLYKSTDIPVVTAVRLAATFPYVTPAARKMYTDSQGKTPTNAEYHMIDGGYYDNYGVASLLEWLEQGFVSLQNAKKEIPDVLIIQIRSFPDDADSKKEPRGWFYQTYAPIQGLLSVRTTAQLISDQQELTLLAERWAKTTPQGTAVDRIHFATFQFWNSNAPLSWAMNPKQSQSIQAEWIKYLPGGPYPDDLTEVRCFFDPKFPACIKRVKKDPW